MKRSAAHAHSINRTVVSATPTVRAHQLAAAQVTHMKAHFLVWHATTNAALAPPSPPPAWLVQDQELMLQNVPVQLVNMTQELWPAQVSSKFLLYLLMIIYSVCLQVPFLHFFQHLVSALQRKPNYSAYLWLSQQLLRRHYFHQLSSMQFRLRYLHRFCFQLPDLSRKQDKFSDLFLSQWLFWIESWALHTYLI